MREQNRNRYDDKTYKRDKKWMDEYKKVLVLGGQTVTLGNVIWDIGKVSIVVDIGLWLQLSNDEWIK